MKTKSSSPRSAKSDALPRSNASTPVPRTFSSLPTQAEIAARAQMIWNERGRPADSDLEIWLQAERELTRPLPTTAHAEPEVTLNRDGEVAGPVEASLDQVASPPERRSPTSL